MFERKRIGAILEELQVMTAAEVERVVLAMRQRRDQTKFGQMAREMGLVREEHILAALAVQMQLFPNVSEMSLRQLLGRLNDPIRTPPRLHVRELRRLLPTLPKKRV